MKNFNKTMKTEDFVATIRLHVKNAIDCYDNGKPGWVTHVDIAYYLIKSLCLMGLKINADFSDSWDELMMETTFKDLFRYKDISDYINTK